MSTAKFGFIRNQIWAFKSPRRRCSRMRRSNDNGCFVAIRSIWSFFHFVWFCHLFGTMKERISFAPAFVSMRHVPACITVFVAPCDIQSLYISFAVTAMLFTCIGIPSGSSSETGHSRGFFISFNSVPILRKKNDPRWCVLTCVGICSSGGASSVFWTTGRAYIACCAFVGLVIMLRELVSDPPALFFRDRHRSRGFLCSRCMGFPVWERQTCTAISKTVSSKSIEAI